MSLAIGAGERFVQPGTRIARMPQPEFDAAMTIGDFVATGLSPAADLAAPKRRLLPAASCDTIQRRTL